mmetsp:Transcript_4491/g.12388  ORF Transcript_4491/g.12388 Transcript_4491/m.12388 type:complete len:538 (-) Transcript_4491:134-1747(-)
MSATTLQQLRESYARVIEGTLQRIRSEGILRQAAVIDELRCRWEAALERELSAMEAQLGFVTKAETKTETKIEPGTGLVTAHGGMLGTRMPLVPVGENFAAPVALPEHLKLQDGEKIRAREGIDWAENFELPPAPSQEQIEDFARRRGAGGHESINNTEVEVAPTHDGARPTLVDIPPLRKRPRTGQAKAMPSQTPALASGSSSSAPLPASAPAESAEVVIAEVVRLKAILDGKESSVEDMLAALEALSRLGELPTRILTSTQIGKTVNQVAKASARNDVSEAAKGLVEEWRNAHRRRKSEKSGRRASSSGAPSLAGQSCSGNGAKSGQIAERSTEQKASGSKASSSAGAAESAAMVTPGAPSKAAGESDDEYDGCFEGAEVIVSQNTPGAPQDGGDEEDEDDGGEATHPASDHAAAGSAGGERRRLAGRRPAPPSPGSELGSDLDDSEFDEPEVENYLYADFARVRRGKRRWTVQFRHGVLRVHGVECLFSSASGVFDIDSMGSGAPLPGVIQEGALQEGALQEDAQEQEDLETLT